MKTMKRIVVALLCVATLISALVLVSCGACSHTYGEWTVAEEATCTVKGREVRVCTKCDEPEVRDIDMIAHAYGEWETVPGSTCAGGQQSHKCTVCGHEETASVAGAHVGGIICDVCGEPIVSFDDIDISFAPTENLAVVLKDFKTDIVDKEYPEDDAIVSIDLVELVLSLDEEGEIAGCGHGTITFDAKNFDMKNTLDVVVYVEDYALYAAPAGSTSASSSDRGAAYFMFDIAKLAELASTIDKAQEALATAEIMLPKIQAWVEDSLIPLFDEIAIEFDEDAAEALMYKLLDAVFVSSTDDNGTTLTFSFDALKAANDVLYNNTISEIVDIVFGEGEYQKAKDSVPALLNFSVESLIEYVEDEGIDLASIFAALDALAVELTGSEDATFEKTFFGEEFAIDFSEYIYADEIQKLSVRDALIAALGYADDPATDENEANAALSAWINDIFDNLETLTFYVMMGEGADKDAIDDQIDQIAETFNYSITISGDGKSIVTTIVIDSEGASVTLTNTVTDGKSEIGFVIDTEKEINIDLAIVVDYTPIIDKADFAISLAQIKDEIGAIVITEDNYRDIFLHDEYSVVAPLYDEEGVFIGFTVTDVYEYQEDGDPYICDVTETTTYYYYLDNFYGYALSSSCKIYMAQLYAFTEYVTVCNREYRDSDGEMKGAESSSNRAYDLKYLDCCFDPETDTFCESLWHNWSLDEDASVDAACDGFGKRVYICNNCGEVSTNYYFEEHSFDFTSVSGNKINYVCNKDGCGKTYVITVVVAGEDDVELELPYYSYWNSVRFAANIEQDGDYVVTCTTELGYNICLYDSYDDYAEYDLENVDDCKVYTFRDLSADEDYQFEIDFYTFNTFKGDGTTITLTVEKI